MKIRKIGKILLLALGICIVWLGARALMDAPAYKDILSSAVYLEEPVVLPENEGKMVIIHGKPEMMAPAYDEELGITLNSIKAYRYDEEYKQTVWGKKSNTYDWVSLGQKGIPGKASLGEFILDDQTLIAFPADSDYEDFDFAELNANGYSLARGKTAEGATTDRWYVIAGASKDEAYYFDSFEYSWDTDIAHFKRELDKDIVDRREGTKAYAYKVYAGSVSDEHTIAGIQRGNSLVAHEKLLGVVNNGVLSQEQLIKTRSGYLMGDSIVFLALGLVCIVFALKPGKKGKKQVKKQKRG